MQLLVTWYTCSIITRVALHVDAITIKLAAAPVKPVVAQVEFLASLVDANNAQLLQVHVIRSDNLYIYIYIIARIQ